MTQTGEDLGLYMAETVAFNQDLGGETYFDGDTYFDQANCKGNAFGISNTIHVNALVVGPGNAVYQNLGAPMFGIYNSHFMPPGFCENVTAPCALVSLIPTGKKATSYGPGDLQVELR